MKLRIAIVLDAPELCGGVLNAVRAADLLRADGHRVILSARGGPPGWLEWEGGWHDHEGFRAPLPEQDLVVATYWTTVPWAVASGAPRVVHFCQGYEGDLAHLAAERPAIEAVYRLPLPTWVVSPALSRRLAAFGKAPAVIPPSVSPRFRPALRLGPRSVARILVTGIFEAHVKNVPTALRAVLRLREMGQACRVERLSPLPGTEEESRLLPADAYHHHLAPRSVARLVRRFDLLLFTSRAAEGFGLPVLEAAQAGVPVVISRIPSLEAFAAAGLAAVEPDDVEGFAREARRLLLSPHAWRAARRRGRAAAGTFARGATRAALRAALHGLRLP